MVLSLPNNLSHPSPSAIPNPPLGSLVVLQLIRAKSIKLAVSLVNIQSSQPLSIEMSEMCLYSISLHNKLITVIQLNVNMLMLLKSPILNPFWCFRFKKRKGKSRRPEESTDVLSDYGIV